MSMVAYLQHCFCYIFILKPLWRPNSVSRCVQQGSLLAGILALYFPGSHTVLSTSPSSCPASLRMAEGLGTLHPWGRPREGSWHHIISAPVIVATGEWVSRQRIFLSLLLSYIWISKKKKRNLKNFLKADVVTHLTCCPFYEWEKKEQVKGSLIEKSLLSMAPRVAIGAVEIRAPWEQLLLVINGDRPWYIHNTEALPVSKASADHQVSHYWCMWLWLHLRLMACCLCSQLLTALCPSFPQLFLH